MAEREPDWDAIAEQEIESRQEEYGRDDDDIIKDAASLTDWDIITEDKQDGDGH